MKAQLFQLQSITEPKRALTNLSLCIFQWMHLLYHPRFHRKSWFALSTIVSAKTTCFRVTCNVRRPTTLFNMCQYDCVFPPKTNLDRFKRRVGTNEYKGENRAALQMQMQMKPSLLIINPGRSHTNLKKTTTWYQINKISFISAPSFFYCSDF